MSEVAQTLEGWYALHDFRALDWQAWKAASESARRDAIAEFNDLVKQWRDKEQNNGGSTAIYNIVGHKADFLFMNLRPTMEELNEAEYAFNRTALADYTYRPYSYVSVVELSNYINASAGDPMENPEIRARLFPVLPQTRHLCFYPMNKRRDGADNWYMLDMDQRRTMMRSHSMIGRSYAGRVKQIISGSVGFDDWEWGVTLFSDDAITFKKLIYEMRFDEVSARYGDFGEFYVGNLLDEQQLNLILG